MNLDFEHVVLERLKYQKRSMYSNYESLNIALKPFIENSVDHMVVTLVATVLGERQPSLEFGTPATWWDHLKLNVLDRHRLTHWIVKRWPVKYRVKRYNVDVLYPYLKISLPNEKPVVVISKMGEIATHTPPPDSHYPPECEDVEK